MIKTKTKTTWRKVKLGEVGYIITGKTPPTSVKKYFGKKYPFITPSDINSFDVRYNYKTERFLSPDWYNKSKSLIIPKDSICFVCIGSTIGKMCLTREESFTNQQINTVIAKKEKADPLFLFYLLKNNQNNIVKEYGGGGAAKSIINKSTFENIELFIPEDINEQKRMADILSAFDDKIEVNNKIIKTLEEMAQEVFKEWFVRFRFSGWQKVKFVDSELEKIPEEWKVGYLGDGIYSEIIKPKVKKFEGEKIYLATADVEKNEIVNEKTKISYNNRPIRANMEPVLNSIWFAKMINTYKVLFFFEGNKEDIEKYILSTGFMGIKALKDMQYYLYLFINSIEFHQIKDTLVQGAVQEAITNTNVKQIQFLVPSETLLNEFNKKVEPLLIMAYKLKKENQKLTALRDLLLPKLMSGETRL